MAKLKPELQHKEGEAPAVDPALAAAVAAQLSQQATAQVGAPVTIAPEQIAAVIPPPTEDVEEARRKIREMFAAPVPETEHVHPELGAVDAPAAPEPNLHPQIRAELIKELLALQWKHSEAVWVADRVDSLFGEGETDLKAAKDNAIYEFHKKDAPEPPIVPAEKTRGAAPWMEKVYGPTTDAEATALINAGYHRAKMAELDEAQQAAIDAVQAVQQDASHLTDGDPNELTQIVHNLQRDVLRLAKLLGLEGVKKTRKSKNG